MQAQPMQEFQYLPHAVIADDSRWHSHSWSFLHQRADPNPNGAYNLLLSIVNTNDQQLRDHVNEALGSLSGIGPDKDHSGYLTQLRGNPAAQRLINDTDAVFEICRTLVRNFEVQEPSTSGRDVNWLQERLRWFFGASWADAMAGKDLFQSALDFALLGYYTRWRVMSHSNHLLALMKQPVDGSIPDTQRRVAFINSRIHGIDYLADFMLAQISDDKFPNMGDGFIDPMRLHASAHGIAPATTSQIKSIVEGEAHDKNIQTLYRWFVDYMNRFELWRDCAIGVLAWPDRVKIIDERVKRLYKWVVLALNAWNETLTAFLTLHREYMDSPPPHRIRFFTWKTLDYCIRGVTALVSRNRMNGIIENKSKGMWAAVTGVDHMKTFPHFPATRRYFPGLPNLLPTDRGEQRARGAPGGPEGLGGAGK
ncbi:hypothetical protein F4808DRAFT_144411 [Astrocystis sublimbata]|nr:hypothetical protein F4808DRAFT_144411 [Astrocystis sublimbata]